MLLLTAFRPFGPIRGWLMRKNASLDVLEAIRDMSPGNHHYLVLDVSKSGLNELSGGLERLKPSGVLAMGELLSLSGSSVKLEPYAVHARPCIASLFRDKKEEESEFVQKSAVFTPGSSIGIYYCNAAYLTCLEWSKTRGGVPVAFVHIPVLGDREKHVQQVRTILWEMARF